MAGAGTPTADCSANRSHTMPWDTTTPVRGDRLVRRGSAMKASLEPVVPFSPAQIEAGAEHPPAQKRSEESDTQFYRTGQWKKRNHKVEREDQEACSHEGNARDEPNTPASSAWWHKWALNDVRRPVPHVMTSTTRIQRWVGANVSLALADADPQLLTHQKRSLAPQVVPSAEFVRGNIMDPGDFP